MKSYKILFIVFALVLIVSACGTSKTTSGGGEGSQDKKTLKVVTNAEYAPFEYMDKGNIKGFDLDFIKVVAKEAGYQINVVNTGWDPLFVEIKGKTADFGISAITINDERKQTYDFSTPYFLSTNEILVPDGSTIKGAADLKGKKVAVQNGTTGQEAVETILGKNSPDLKKFESTNLAIMELKGGGVDAVVADNTVVEEYVKNNPNEKVVLIKDDAAFEKEFYGLMFPKGSKLKADFDKAIKTVLENGEYAKIYQQWFKAAPDVSLLSE
ncbi:basic amino acid ABC transporter substrate-binding protein [Paenibacillus sp. BSR1-1]|uniref:basic amino acid ABC transporter substrate-binding protein n=1 Tax=Paenibacillus sp. BSR1-1 TaxID=3020845 RepID=UPI0025B2523C|nr:basic amino acid ABC transporter substrate-binding protein [Paenibacillus sp. BSR1-1]MDN3017917.1 basic amino acid ABC transporter substrate-binding protein [Paenibacillus sp. BSR1-1]